MSDVLHQTELCGLPVHHFPDQGDAAGLPEADQAAWRLSVDNPYGSQGEKSSFEEYWGRFLDAVDPARVRALVIGQWDEIGVSSSGVVELLVAARERLTGLEGLFLGDMEMEESEISWIVQSDVGPLLEAFPGLRYLGVRGGDGLLLPPVRHGALRELVLESGGLPAAVLRGLAGSELPALERLELWLGVEEYGADWTLEDLAPLLEGKRFPSLRHLGLQNSEQQDEIAAAVASAPVVAQLSSLSLAMGTLTDGGAEALLHGQPLSHLERLDLHHHYLGDAMQERIRTALEPAGVEVDLSEPEEGDEEEDGEVWRYAAVTE